MKKIAGIGECIVSNNRDDVLITCALASCVGMTVYDPEKNAAGMAHIALPAPDRSNDNGSIRPYYYASTAVPLLISRMCDQYGCAENRLKIRLFGGADSLREKDMFQIGRKNLSVIKDLLAQMGLRYDASETGGKYSRTLEMDVSSGIIKLTLQPIRI